MFDPACVNILEKIIRFPSLHRKLRAKILGNQDAMVFPIQCGANMQFIPNGPEIPNALLQSHEDGRLVFFCGAGISIPAGLPTFKTLVTSICAEIGTNLKAPEDEAYNAEQYDRALHLLENRLPGGRKQMREALWKCLQPKLCQPEALRTHESLLTLGYSRDCNLRLVTTNFDRLFVQASCQTDHEVRHLAAPYFPLPRNDRWNGIVYLHGLLPENCDDKTTLNSLIVTSADFGAAYLHEQRTSRFVSELMREYDICLVGYSLGDAILRYMFDALAAVRPQTTAYRTTICWALVEDTERNRRQWATYNVEPIFYDPKNDHVLLHSTLYAWAKYYKNESQIKEDIISQYAQLPPDSGTQEDDFVGRVLWALSDKSGRPAERFAQLDPPPPLEWLLEAFSRENSPLAPLLSDTEGAGRTLIQNLFPWILKHTHDPRLLIWILQQNAQQQEQYRQLFLWRKLDEIGKNPSLDEEERAYIRRVFSLFRAGVIIGANTISRVVPPPEKHESFLSACVRLRHALAPGISIRMGISRYPDEPIKATRKFVPYLPEIILSSDTTLLESSLEQWRASLPCLTDPIQQHLLDSLVMLENLTPEDINAQHDLSYFYLPSIARHKQNQHHSARALLMTFLREAWDSLLQQDRSAAIKMAEDWFEKPYPTFKRFALYAAAHDGVIEAGRWVDWLHKDNGYWLWTSETKREVCRLLVLQGNGLRPDMRNRLEDTIMAGPPRDIWRKDLEEETYLAIKKDLTYLLLKKLSQNCSLSPQASSVLNKLKDEYPQLQLDEEEQEEFSIWIGTPRDVPSLEISISTLPQTSEEIANWISECDFQLSNISIKWRMLCRERRDAAFEALKKLAAKDSYCRDVWWEAIQVWTEEIQEAEFHQEILNWLLQLETDKLSLLAPSCSWWLERCVEHNLVMKSEYLTTLCDRILFETATNTTIEDIEDIVIGAINSSQGRTAQALFKLWANSGLKDNGGLDGAFLSIFSRLCRNVDDFFIYAQVFLGRYAITLFRVDRDWTEDNLLPLFDWAANESIASACWSGFLWGARLYPDFLRCLWPFFIVCSEHYTKLGEMRRRYIQLAIHIALEKLEEFPSEEIKKIFDKLPIDALPTVLICLNESIERSAENLRAAFVLDHIIPFLHEYWPKDKQQMTPKISYNLALLVIASGSAFSEMLKTCQYSLGPVSNLVDILYQLHDSGICTLFPEEALNFIDRICIEPTPFLNIYLRKCLADLSEAKPTIKNNGIFNRLYSLL